jgi:arylsulfatase A-like enzyme
VRAPGLAPARVRDVVSGVDVMPSLLSLCDVSFDGAIEGKSFVDLMKGGRAPAREAMSEVRWHKGQDMRALRRGECKYVEVRGDEKERDMLFDLAADPGEERDVVGETSACDPNIVRDALGKHLGHALTMARKYPVPEQYAPSPGDWERLKKLGYAGDEPETTPPPKDSKKP